MKPYQLLKYKPRQLFFIGMKMENKKNIQLTWDDVARKSYNEVTRADYRTEVARRRANKKGQAKRKDEKPIVIKGFLGYGAND